MLITYRFDDVVKLKKGLADSFPELVVALKKLLHPVSSESEIDDYLVRPFLPVK